jgi:stage V sporulation protein B
VYLWSKFRPSYAQLGAGTDTPDSFAHTAKQLLIIAVPITLGSAGLQILTALETKIYMGRLLGMMTQDAADIQRGIYSMAQTIFNMPCAFITPITISIIPAITGHLTLKNTAEARETEESAVRVMALISMPCAFGLATLAEPVTALLGGYKGEDLVLATGLMAVLGISIIFNAIVLVTTAIMQAHGHVNRPVVNMFLGGLVKLAVVFLLTGNPAIGILGTPIGTLLCYLVITVLNITSIRSLIPEYPAILKNALRPFAAAAIMGGVVYASLLGLKMLGITSRLILCGAPIAVGVVVYAVLVVAFKCITRSDCLLLPKGAKIAKLLRL